MVKREVQALSDVLTSILPVPPLSFDQLKIVPRIPAFDPGPLGIVPSAPDWSQYAPPRALRHRTPRSNLAERTSPLVTPRQSSGLSGRY